MKRISPEFSFPHQKLSRLWNFTRRLDSLSFQACFHLWRVTGNTWNQSCFTVPSQTWRAKNLIFKCIFSTSFSHTTCLVALAFVCFWQNNAQSICQNKTIFEVPGYCYSKGKGSLDQNGTTSSIWHHSINLISRAQGCFSLKSGPSSRPQSTSESCNLHLQHLWPGNQPPVGRKTLFTTPKPPAW